MTTVVGIDGSLVAAGVAVVKHPATADSPNLPTVRVVGEPGHRADSLARIATRIGDQAARILRAMPPKVALVVIEALPRGVPNPDAASMYQERAALHYRVVEFLARRAIPVAEVSVGTLKLWATGNGRAEKADVMMAMRELWPGCRLTDFNAADAVALASLGCQHLGWYPPEATHHYAPKVRWPEGITAA